MRDELQNKLVSNFPNLFINDSFDGFWVDDSWYDLIYKLSEDINKIILKSPKHKQEQFYVTQVKNKFGGLRYYTSNSHPEINEIISEAENKSYDICYGCSGTLEKEAKRSWNDNHCVKCSAIKNLLE